VLGMHGGVHRFTVGQRRGLGLGGGQPRFVQRIEGESRRIVVGPPSEAERSCFRVLRPNWICRQPKPDAPVWIKVRHRHSGARGRVRIEANGQAMVQLESPLRAVTPGQAAVFYDGARVLGGGWICLSREVAPHRENDRWTILTNCAVNLGRQNEPRCSALL